MTTTEGFAAPVSRDEIEAGVDMGRVRRADENGVRGFRRPARHVGGAEIGRVELGTRDLGDAVDAADAGRGRVPSLPPRQRLPLVERRLLGDGEARKTERDAAGDRSEL